MRSAQSAIQMVDLHAQYLQIQPEIDSVIANVVAESAFIGGKHVTNFQKNLSHFLGGFNVTTCGNGTDALQLALMALNLSPGDEVIVPAFSFVAPAEAITLLGFTPVFADVDEFTFNISAATIEPLVTARTKAIIVVHLFGQMADMAPIIEISEKLGLKIIEDSAQAFGASYLHDGDQKLAGTLGTIGCTSFFPSKNLACFGDGGALYTKDDAIAKRIKMMANHGQDQKYSYELIGINSRLDGIQAAILDVKLKCLPQYITARRKAALGYRDRLKGLQWLELPFEGSKSEHSYNQFTIKLAPSVDRLALQDYLRSQGIPTMVYYPKLLSDQIAYKAYKKNQLTVSENLVDTVISLPMHTELTDSQLDFISDALKSYVQY